MIFQVIRAELFKAQHKRRVYVLAALQWLLLPVLALLVGWVLQVNMLDSFADEGGGVRASIQAIASPFGIARLALVLPTLLAPPFLIIVIALLAALLIGEERAQNMWKTVLVAQPWRPGVMLGKLIAAMLLLAMLMLGSYVSGVVFGGLGSFFLVTDFSGEWWDLARLYALQWLFAWAAMLFAFVMVWLIRNLALAMVSIFFLPALFEGVYTIVQATVGFERINRFNAIFQALRLRQRLEDLPRYFFTNNLYFPSREPLGQIVRSLGGDPGSDMGPLQNVFSLNVDMRHAALVMAGYGVVFALFLFWRFSRSDMN